MAIISNNFTQDTSYFISHTPPKIGSDESVIDSISDMVSYNIIPPETDVIINQKFGEETYFNFKLVVQNLTKNVNLQIQISTDEFLFNLDVDGNFILLPNEIREIVVGVDRDKFNSLGSEAQVSEKLQIKIENLDINTYAVKDLTIESLNQFRFSDRLDVE
jgi:hypothetical protein